MKTAMKRVASLLLALIMILEVVAPGIVEAHSAGQNRATVSDEEFIPPAGNRIDPDQNAGSHLPNFIDPDDDGYYTPRKSPARPAQNASAQAAPKQGNEGNAAADVEVSEEKAPKPLIQDEGETAKSELELEFSREMEQARVASPTTPGGIENNKFTILTRWDISNAAGTVRPGQFFTIKLDDKLKVKPETVLPELSHKDYGVIATPKYDENKNTITYTLTKPISSKISVPIKIDVDYNTENIDPKAKQFVIKNSVSGLGVVDSKPLLPVAVDSNGNMLSTILEPGGKDVLQTLEYGAKYKVDVKAFGVPVVENKEITKINWKVYVKGNQPLASLGYATNFTAVEGSGIGQIENLKAFDANHSEIPGESYPQNDGIVGRMGIVDSRHHTLAKQEIKEFYYTFSTPVTNKQTSYMLDISVALTKSPSKRVGAVRFILPDGYDQSRVEENSPTRVGMNNRTTVKGEFTSEQTAAWTITDAVSTGDANEGLPLVSRKLSDNQDMSPGASSGRTAVYTLNPETGKMETAPATSDYFSTIPKEKKNPMGPQKVGTIAVYKVYTDLKNWDQPERYSIVDGLFISKYQDLRIFQEWNLTSGASIPRQTFTVRDDQNQPIGSHEEPGVKGKKERLITISGVKKWNIVGNQATPVTPTIEQTFNSDSYDPYEYWENQNYYRPDDKYFYMHNTAVKRNQDRRADFSVLKIDDKDPTKKLQGAEYTLIGTGLWENKEGKLTAITDKNGKTTFTNIPQGSYTLVETKAPAGYKLDRASKIINVDERGRITVSGDNASLSGGAGTTQINRHDIYPSYMNTMHYGKIENNNLTFYVYLKPEANVAGGSTDRATRLNIRIPGVDKNKIRVDAYDVDTNWRYTVRTAMENQTAQNLRLRYSHSGSVMYAKDPYTGEDGCQIKFSEDDFRGDWGYLVKVTVDNVGKKEASVIYDWLTENDTARQAKLQLRAQVFEVVNGKQLPLITITNEAFKKQAIAITKVDKDKNPLPGAVIALKDTEGNTLRTIETTNDGKANFGDYTPGTYIIEEIKAPDKHIKTNVIFEVTVAEDGKVTYKPKYKNSPGNPSRGEDYFIKTEEVEGGTSGQMVTSVEQNLTVNENQPGDIGTKENVWEAFRFESLKYHATINVSTSQKNDRFEIHFDPNLDFTQYVKEIPKAVDNQGKEVADPYFDYNTNILTYVFNGNSGGGPSQVTFDISGIIPSKYYAKYNGSKDYTITVPRAQTINKTVFPITADYGYYDSDGRGPSQAYYFKDIYKGDDGKTYVTAFAYYNPFADYRGGSRTLRFNWLSTEYGGGATNIVRWPARGYRPAFTLQNIKVYSTLPNIRRKGDSKYNLNMPLSFGIRPEQDPLTYSLVYNANVDPNNMMRHSQSGISVTYNPSQIQTSGPVSAKSPLTMTMPGISRNNEGYIIEQTFRVDDDNTWLNKWRVFYMSNGTLESGFANKPVTSSVTASQTEQTIPKSYREVVQLINKGYTPGKFKIHKIDAATGATLNGARFTLYDSKGKAIAEKTSIQDGIIQDGPKAGQPNISPIEFADLEPGNYTLKETKAPPDHLLSNKTWQISVDANGIVTIVEQSASGTTAPLTGPNIYYTVTNNPAGGEFKVFKKSDKGQPLSGARFKITKLENNKPTDISGVGETNNEGRIESFTDANDSSKTYQLERGKRYLVEETNPPAGYQKINKKWVVEVGLDGKTKVYDYVEVSGSTGSKLPDYMKAPGTKWVDVANRDLTGWILNDHRQTGYADRHREPYKLGTRIIAVNKDRKYVIQRYVINPEMNDVDISTAIIHREKLNDPNMDWYSGSAEIHAYELDQPVTSNVEDIRLTNFNPRDITSTITKTSFPGSGSNRLVLTFNTPIKKNPVVIDVKVPFKNLYGGVGTGMDLYNLQNNESQVTWKSDFYERAELIKEGKSIDTDTEGNILGSHVSDGSLEVVNEPSRFKFTLKKVKSGGDQPIKGAAFKLKGPIPEPKPNETTTPEIPERTLYSGENGEITFDNLLPGKYTMVEAKPAPGYKPTDTIWTITVGKDGKVLMKDNNTADPKPTAPATWNVGGTAIEPTSLMSHSAQLEGFLAPFGTEENASWSTESKAAEAAKEKASPTAEESTVAKAENKEAQAPAETSEAKVENKEAQAPAETAEAKAENKEAQAVAETAEAVTEQISRTKQLDNFLTTFGANSGPELGEEIVSSPVGAASDWKSIDPNRSKDRYHKADAKKSGEGILVETKMTEINKVDHKFKQVFLLKDPSYGKRQRELQFHRQPEDRAITLADVTYTIYQVGAGSTIDSIVGRKDDVTTRARLKRATAPGKPDRVGATIPADLDGPFLVEMVVSYNSTNSPNGIGLGLDYNFNKAATYGNKNWIGESYPGESSINYKHLIKVPSDGSVTADKPYEEAGKTVTLTAHPADGYELESYTVTKDGGGTVDVNGNTFIMPDKDVTVTASFRKKEAPQPTKHKIEIYASVGGEVKAIPTTAAKGEKVTLDVKLDANYKLKSLNVTDQQGPVSVTNNSFTMGDSDVTVTAVFEEKTPQPTSHTITVTQPAEGGTISANKQSAVAGDIVTLTVAPQEGYKLKSLTAGGVAIPLAGPYEFTMPDSDVTITAVFEKEITPEDKAKEIKPGQYARIENDQVGIGLKIYKKNINGKVLPGAEFTLEELDDDDNVINNTKVIATSDEEGKVVFKDATGAEVLLKKGSYRLTETKPPAGYKEPPAPWKIVVDEKEGRLVAEYYGPEQSPSDFVNSDNGKVAGLYKDSPTELTKSLPNGIKYAARATYMNPTSMMTRLGDLAGVYNPEQLSQVGTYAQRLYVDTRNYNGPSDKINVQIRPKHKREEVDAAQTLPYVIKQGVKTAYYTVYKLEDVPAPEKLDEAITNYDLSRPGVKLVKTARWRPFDWGFDEDQLNLEKGGVYFIDVEGFYDKAVVEGNSDIQGDDIQKIDLKYEFYDGERKFLQAVGKDSYGNIVYKDILHGSFLAGNAAILKDSPGDSDTGRKNPNQKYPNGLSREYGGGKIEPALTNPVVAETRIDIRPIYSSKKANEIPQSGMGITNEEETYNITFAKLGKDEDHKTPKELAKNRLEGAVFKLQEQVVGGLWEDIPGSFVASAFNGYFGFRGLKPGRYRLIEVKPPEGYKAYQGTILFMTIEHKKAHPDPNTGEIVPGRGQITFEYGPGKSQGIVQYNKDATVNEGKLVDYVTAATAKNMGSIIDEVPGKGELTLEKKDENGNLLKAKKVTKNGDIEFENGAVFRLVRVSQNEKDKTEKGSESLHYVDDNGKLTIKGLTIGNYRLVEKTPHPGHMTTGQIWNFAVGGKKLDPYAEDPATPTGKDLTANIQLKKADISVQRFMEEDPSRDPTTVYPHRAEGVNIKSEFVIPPGTDIKKGDYFTVKLSDSIDLEGIYKHRTFMNLDIFADGVGTIAKGTYNKRDNTITYTFTGYADQYTLYNIDTNLSAWISLEKIKRSTRNVPVGIGLDGQGLTPKYLNVDYAINEGTSSRWSRQGGNLNITGKIFELDPDTGEFVQYYYINRQRLQGRVPNTFNYKANEAFEYADVTIYKLRDNYNDREDEMPESFAVPERSNKRVPIWQPNRIYNSNHFDFTFDGSYHWDYNYGRYYYTTMNPNDSYVVKIKGKLKDVAKTKGFRTTGSMLAGGYLVSARHDWAYFAENKAEAKAKLEFTAINPTNRIQLKKVDAQGKPLAGAKFNLLYKKNKGDSYGPFGELDKESTADGLITFSALKEGYYQVIETKPPEGYLMKPGPILNFRVDSEGKIWREVKGENGKVEEIQDIGDEAIDVVNHLPIKFKKVKQGTDEGLVGATFKLLYKEKLTDEYDDYKVDGNKQIISSGPGGAFELKLTKPGYYALKETKAPEDYSVALGYVKEFAIIDGKIKTKEKAVEGLKIKKDPLRTSDADESMIYGGVKHDFSQTSGTRVLDMYYVINPSNEEKTYTKEQGSTGDTFTITYESDNLTNHGAEIEVYGLDKDQKIDAGVTPMKLTGTPSKDGKSVTFDLHEMVAGKGVYGSKTSSKRWVIKVPADDKGLDSSEAMSVIRTTLKRGKDTYTARYTFKNEDLLASFDQLKKELSQGWQTFTGIYVDYKEDKTHPQVIPIENKKAVYPLAGGFGPRKIVLIGVLIATIAAGEYLRRKRRSAAPKGGA